MGPMLRWGELRRTRPDLGSAGLGLLYQFGVGLAFLATVRSDGGPRLHPMGPLVTDDALLGFLQPSPKRQDLPRDGRYALHSFPSDDNEDAFYLSGQAVPVHDPDRRRAATAQFLAERRLDTIPAGFEAQELFEFHIQRCLWTAITGHAGYHDRPPPACPAASPTTAPARSALAPDQRGGERNPAGACSARSRRYWDDPVGVGSRSPSSLVAGSRLTVS
jgi:hypothetical protein